MRALVKSIHRLIRDTKAATAVEYGLICALIVLAIMAALLALGTVAKDLWNNVSQKVETAG
jgi:pilus assembly protein Flp/PilA